MADETTNFTGVFTALVTPFQRDGSVDFDAFRNLIDWQIASGIHGLVPCGTTGEASTLSDDEVLDVVQTCVKTADRRVPVIGGGSRNDTRAAVDFQKRLADIGVDGTLHATPWYNKPTQEGLYRHYRAVAEAADVTVVLYNVPGRTSVDLHPDTVVRLATDCPNIVAIKEASGSIARAEELKVRTMEIRDDFKILSGEDAFFLGLLALGGHGVISVASNLVPEEMSSLYRAFSNGDIHQAQRLSHRLQPLIPLLFHCANPIPVKTAMAFRGMMGNNFRLPLAPLSDLEASTFRENLEAQGWLNEVRP